MSQFKFLVFGPEATAVEQCKKCGAQASGLALINGWFPMYACTPCSEDLRKAELAADADAANDTFAKQEFIA